MPSSHTNPVIKVLPFLGGTRPFGRSSRHMLQQNLDRSITKEARWSILSNSVGTRDERSRKERAKNPIR